MDSNSALLLSVGVLIGFGFSSGLFKTGMFNGLTSSFFVGALIGFASFSGLVSQVFGIDQIWISNPNLPVWQYHVNLVFTSIMIGFSTVGMQIFVDKVSKKID